MWIPPVRRSITSALVITVDNGDKDKDTCDQTKNNEREGTQSAQIEGESPSDDNNQIAAQLL